MPTCKKTNNQSKSLEFSSDSFFYGNEDYIISSKIKNSFPFIIIFILFTCFVHTQIYADVFTKTITENNDAAEEQNPTNGSMSINSTDLELVYDRNTEQYVGLRFQNITIPKNSTINSAHIQFTVDETDDEDTNVVIYGEDTSSANEYSSSSKISPRAHTSSFINWTIPEWDNAGDSESDQKTPDIKSIVQEIINRTDWNSGNNMAFIIKPGSNCDSSDCQRTAESSGNQGPELIIDYTENNPSPCSGTGSGLCGEYFNKTSSTSRDTPISGVPTKIRNDANIDFSDFNSQKPTGINNDYFQIRWTGCLTIPVTGSYKFQTWSDDGVKVWVDNQLVVDDWVNQGASWSSDGESNFVTYQAGQYPFKTEYYEHAGGNRIRVAWTSSDAGISTQTVIPAQYFSQSCGITPPPPPGDENVPNEDSNATETICGTFEDMFQTHGTCSGTSGGTINFNNAGSLLDGSKNIILNNTDNSLNTCQVTTPTWVSNQFETCGTEGDCEETGTSGTILNINYTNPPSVVNISDSPSLSTNDITLNTNSTQTEYQYDDITTGGGNTNINTIFNITNQLQINTLKMTTNNTFNFQSSNPYSLEIGTLGIENNGASNTITTDNNAKNIKINTFLLKSNTNLTLEASQTIKMEDFTIGRGSNINLKAPYININNFTSSNAGSGDSIIEIYADYIDIGDLTLEQTVTLKIYPFTPNKRVLFRVNNLAESSSSSIQLSSGNYYVNSNLSIPGTSDISAMRSMDENQLINLYINNSLTLGNNPGINAIGNKGNYDTTLPAANFMMFINGDLTTGGGGTTLNATIYLEGDATFGNPTYIKGAINANTSIEVGQGQFIYDQSISDAGWDECDSYSCANPKDFNIAFTDNIRGNMITVGNTNMCYNDGGTCGDPGNRRNNSINMMYSDPDGSSNTTTFNSSSTTFQLDADSKIQWAKLYWQGYLVSETNAVKSSAKQVLFKTPTTGYQTIDNSFDDYDYNWVYFTADRYYYQGSANVTSLVQNSGAGTYTVANIVSQLGTPAGGSYGGWSLVIVYKNENQSLKNLTVFDGYQGVVTGGDENSANSYATTNSCPSSGVGNEISFPLSGFLTPTTGDVISSLLVFAGEGDKGASGDHIRLTDKNGNAKYIDNDLNPYNDIFNSTITYNGESLTNTTTPISIDPSYSANSNGIDIDIFDVSTDKDGNELIGNNQKSTTITLDTSGDGYMPGVFAFSTELYEPRVCYYIDTIKQKDTNTTIFEDKKFISEIDTDKEYTFDIWISNMKKSSLDTFIETAKLVQVYMNMNGIDYSENSMSMQNLGETSKSSLSDAIDSDLGEFENDDNKSTWRVGIDAVSSQGGTLEAASGFNDDTKKAFITYKGKFIVDENTSSLDLLDFFEFKASFQTDSITIGSDNAQLIEQCVDLNTSATVIQPPQGAFNVVNENFSGSSISNDYDTALFTQVSGQDFNITVLALDNDFQTLKNYTGDVNLSLIATPFYTGNSTLDDNLCNNASPLTNQTITFNNADRVSTQLTINNALQNVSFKIAYPYNSNIKYVCSTDTFSIRPAKFNYNLTPTPLIGGKAHTILSTAVTQSNLTNTSYLGSATQSISLVIPTGCTVPADNNSTTITFLNGVDSSFIRTGNIGDYNLTILDNSWTDNDKGTSHGDDCIVGSSDNNHTSGKVGCNTQTSQTFTFNPKDFNISLNISDFNGNNFTYISNDANMSATTNMTITARLDDNATATSYTEKCYAKDINTTITLLNNPTDWSSNNHSTAKNRITFFDDNTTTSFENNATGTATLSSNEGNFTNGVANIMAKFNFKRIINNPDDPFKIARDDFNISVIDTNNTSGSDFDRTVNDYNTTFYYGRVHAPDQRFQGDEGDATIYYEVYCQDCNETKYNINGNESVDSINWYNNTLHVNTIPGNYNQSNPTAQDGTAPIITDYNTLNLQHAAPHKDKITLTPNSWLVHDSFDSSANTTDFIVEFYKAGSKWAGEGQLGETVDVNISTRQNRRLDW